MRHFLFAVTSLLIIVPSVHAEQAFMILRVGWEAGAFGDIREFSSMAACEAVAEHIARVRTPSNSTTSEVPGAWKFSFSRAGTYRHEPLVSMLCVPGPSEMEAVKKGLNEKGWYRGL